MLLVFALHYDRAQTHEREVITNGWQGQGSYSSQNGFFFPQLFTEVCTSTPQRTTVLTWDIKLYHINFCDIFLSLFSTTSFSQPLLAPGCLSFNKHLLYCRNILCCLLHQSCQGAKRLSCHFHMFVRRWQIQSLKGNTERRLQIADKIIMKIWEIPRWFLVSFSFFVFFWQI